MKALSFRQKAQIEQYLFILQKFVDDPKDPEVLAVLKESSDALEQFLTIEEIQSLEAEIELPEHKRPQETIDLGHAVLPRGWYAEDYEVSEPVFHLDMKNKVIGVSMVISEKREDGDIDEWYED